MDAIMNAPVSTAGSDIDGWLPHDGGDRPVPTDARVDLRFAGYDSIRTPPYIRHHEMWDQEAGSARWPHYGRHHSNITHWRPSRDAS